MDLAARAGGAVLLADPIGLQRSLVGFPGRSVRAFDGRRSLDGGGPRSEKAAGRVLVEPEPDPEDDDEKDQPAHGISFRYGDVSIATLFRGSGTWIRVSIELGYRFDPSSKIPTSLIVTRTM